MKSRSSEDKILFVCNSCGNEFPKWSGRCSGCGEWNSLVETRVSIRDQKSKISSKGGSASGGKNQNDKSKNKNVSLASVSPFSSHLSLLTTGFVEFDRTIGGGFVPGQVILLAGEPGIGKSTLLLQVAEAARSKIEVQRSTEKTTSNVERRTGNVLYVAGEESPLQIKQRADRLGIKGEAIEIVAATDVDEIIDFVNSKSQIPNPKSPPERDPASAGQIQNSKSQIPTVNCQLLIVDSVQTLTTEDVLSSAGSVAQVKECARRLTTLCKDLNLPLILVGHVNKEGDIAGPKVLEHIVDTVLYLEGERTLPFRLLRAVKNRFGDPSEVGVWQMTEKGFAEVKNPSAALVSEGGGAGLPAQAGTAIGVMMEGTRPMLVEFQSLTTRTSFGYPRRTASGFELNRLLFLIAAIEKHLKISLQGQDVYVNVTGGIKVTEPAADLPVALAIVSSFRDQPIKRESLAFGEVGLTGELRRVSFSEKRSREAEKLGFKNLISPETARTLKEAASKALTG